MADRSRRLTTIVAADIAGYSRLMHADETRTLDRLRQARALTDPIVAAHGGRLVGTWGDGLLLEFPSVVEAVTASQHLQAEMVAFNADTPADQRLLYRIGINLGDVIVEDGDLFGDGVNVAARLEALAEPGGIVLSRAARDQVRDKLDIALADLGEVEVKNIARPVRAFRVLHDGDDTSERPLKPPRRRMRYAAVAAALLILAIGAGAYWWLDQRRVAAPADLADYAYALPEKPSIVVLPFDNISGDAAQDYFADGMTEDLITDLSKISGLFVIARNSSFAYKGKAVDVKRVGHELGVRYVLEGSVRRVGEQVRINAQLIDTNSGGHLWAERYDGAVADVFALQDKINARIVAALAVTLTPGEQSAADAPETAIPAAYDAFLRGWNDYRRMTPESLREAIDALERAIAIDPAYAKAHAALAAVYWEIARRYWHGQFGFRNFHDAMFRAETYLGVARKTPPVLSLQVSTAMLSQQGQHAAALAEGALAIGKDPNDADSYVALAAAMCLAGTPQQAHELVQRAMRLNPLFPPHYLYVLGLARFGVGNFEDAAKAFEQAVARNPDDRWSQRMLLSSYGQSGRLDDARALMDTIERSWRGLDPLTVRAVSFWYPYQEAADRKRLADGLRQAGLPD